MRNMQKENFYEEDVVRELAEKIRLEGIMSIKAIRVVVITGLSILILAIAYFIGRITH